MIHLTWICGVRNKGMVELWFALSSPVLCGPLHLTLVLKCRRLMWWYSLITWRFISSSLAMDLSEYDFCFWRLCPCTPFLVSTVFKVMGFIGMLMNQGRIGWLTITVKRWVWLVLQNDESIVCGRPIKNAKQSLPCHHQVLYCWGLQFGWGLM